MSAQTAQVLNAYQKRTGAVGKIVVASARAEFLSQRLARDYLLTQHKLIKSAKLEEELKADQAEMEATLDMLTHAPISTLAIRQDLELAKTQWIFFKEALSIKVQGRAADENVAKTSERMLEVLEDATIQYERALEAIL